MIQSTACVYRQNTAIAWREIDGEAVLIDPSTGTVFVLNRVGARIWDLLSEPRTQFELVGCIASENDLGVESVENDVAQFIAALDARALIGVER